MTEPIKPPATKRLVPVKGYTTSSGAIVTPHQAVHLVAPKRMNHGRLTMEVPEDVLHKARTATKRQAEPSRTDTANDKNLYADINGVKIWSEAGSEPPKNLEEHTARLELATSWAEDVTKKMKPGSMGGLSEIVIRDHPFEGDAALSKKYGLEGLVSTASIQGKSVDIWSHCLTDEIQSTLHHELGHSIAGRLYGRNMHPPEWMSLCQEEGATTGYSENSFNVNMKLGLKEDFADSFMEYHTNGEEFRKNYPKKWKHLDGLHAKMKAKLRPKSMY